MPTEDDLRAMLGATHAPNTLDSEKIIAKSRRRRVPKQIVAGGVGALAVAGIFVVAMQGIPFGQDASTMSAIEAPAASDAAESSGGSEFSDIKRAPAERLNLCAGPVADLAPSAYGLQFDLEFPAMAPVGTQPIEGTARLTNLGSTRVTGSTAAVPAITLSQNGIVQWHSNGPMIMSLAIVDLEPGQSMEYAASFTPVQCGIEDDTAEAFRADLPALPAGQYDLSAAIDFSADESLVTGDLPYLDLVTGPAATITLQ